MSNNHNDTNNNKNDGANSDKKSQNSPFSLQELLAKQTLADIEKISENLKIAGIASSKLTEAFTEITNNYLEKHPKLDPLGIAPYASEVTNKLASNPERIIDAQKKLWEGYAQIWSDSVKRMSGIAATETKPKEETKDNLHKPHKDKRFNGAEWQSDIMFDMLRKTYLLTSDFLVDLVENVEGVDDFTKRKASFLTKQLADAFSPSNFLFTNPVAIKELIDSRGESINRGLANFLRDIQKGQGKFTLSQTTEEDFIVGKNIATTKGKVIHRGKIFELIQYEPTTETVYEIPLLIFPPWINKYYILDLRESNSMVRWLCAQGYSVFVVSWVNPTQELAEYGFEQYLEQGVLEAVNVVQKATKAKKVNCVGYCVGGTLLAVTLAYLSKINKNNINSATFFASQQDFIEAGDLKIFTDDAAYEYIKQEIEHSGGVLDASVMSNTFNYLRPNDLIWYFVINNYLLGKTPKPFDLLFWNSDQTRMPKALHLYYIEKFYRNNDFAEGRLVIKGEKLSLKDIKIPIYVQASKEDHISPYRSIYRGAKLFGGDVRMILAGSGHIAGVINHPDAHKYQHWLPKSDDILPNHVEDWLLSLDEHEGSWWNDWNKWLSSHSGTKIPAIHPGDNGIKVICDAPGEYVLKK